MKKVVVISKDDCSLCEKAVAILESIQAEHPFTMEIKKIKSGMKEYDKYWDKIPVVIVDGKEEFFYKIDGNKFLQILKS